MDFRAKTRYATVSELERFDERDNVQARNTLEPGSEDYTEFYERHPEWEAKDATTRELSKQIVGNPLDLFFFREQIGEVAQRGVENLVDGPVNANRVELSPERATEKIKGFARMLGADLVRTGPLNPAFIYTNIGKIWHDPARMRGAQITRNHKNAISIAIGLNPASSRPVLFFPRQPRSCESTHNWLPFLSRSRVTSALWVTRHALTSSAITKCSVCLSPSMQEWESWAVMDLC